MNAHDSASTDRLLGLVSIVGGHGQIARHLSRQLAAAGRTVRGLVRDVGQFDDLRDDGAEPVLCDLEASTEEQLDDALSGSETVVFAAGAGPDSGPDRKKTLDRDGAIKSVESAIRVGAQRFVIVSSMGADAPPTDDAPFSIYLQAKHDADVAVRAAGERAGLAYTVVRPGRLTDDEATGSVQLAERADRSEIPRADAAAVIAEIIDSGRLANATFELVSGNTPIAEAVDSTF